MKRWKFGSALVFLTVCTCIAQMKEVSSSTSDVEYKGKEIVELGRPFTIECRLSSFYFPKWTRDGMPLSRPDQDYELSQRKDGNYLVMTLHVDKAKPEHAGEYRCNSFSRETQKISLLHYDEDDSDSDSEDDLTTVTLTPNKTLRIYCKLPKEDTFPVIWFKNNLRILDQQESRIRIKGRNLTIQHSVLSDAGEYMCTSTDVSSLSKPAVSGPHDVIGHITKVKYPAKVESLPRQLNLKHGNTLTLECIVHGSPIPRVKWYIGNIPASFLEETDDRISLIENEQGLPDAILQITNITVEDRNLYTCRGKNSEFTDESSAFVTIRDSIIKTNEPEPGAGIVLEPGKTLFLQCNITEPQLQLELSWRKDNAELGESKDVIMDNSSLTIKPANENNHTGNYQCVARNKQFEIIASADIKVTTRPGVEQFHKSLNLVQGDKLVLNCKFSGIPVPEVSWYINDKIVEMNDSNNHVSYTINLETKTTQLKIDELEYEDRAEYTCSARIGDDIANTTILVRVRDRLAALWPFLGICAEVAILCTIIFVYEKKRSKPEFDDTDNDANTENKNIHENKEGSQDVRHRK